MPTEVVELRCCIFSFWVNTSPSIEGLRGERRDEKDEGGMSPKDQRWGY